MRKVAKVKVLGGYRLALTFDDGARGEVDLSRLVGEGVFAAWKDPEAFRQVRIGPAGELVWGDNIDLCPDALYMEATGRKPEELFPGLAREGMRA